MSGNDRAKLQDVPRKSPADPARTGPRRAPGTRCGMRRRTFCWPPTRKSCCLAEQKMAGWSEGARGGGGGGVAGGPVS